MHITANTLYFAFLLVSAGFTHATDDTPCVSGSCSHSGGDNVNSLVHSIHINGSHESLIGDVTPAAGWNISGCNPNWSSGVHTVQMSCEGAPSHTQYCHHLFNGGAEQTIVRLPDNCGSGPFARVVSINETDGVHTMHLDYDFTQIPADRGNVTFQVNLGNSVPSRTHTALQPRFTKSKSDSFPIGFQKSLSLFNESASCNFGETTVELDLSVDVAGALNASVTLGGTVEGHLLPLPKVTSFQLTADINGTVSLDLNIDAGLHVSTTTGDKPLLSVGLPDLSIPGFFTLGPLLEVDTRADFDASLQSTATVHAQWDINSIHIVFPPSSGNSTRDITPISSDPIHMSANPLLAVGPSVSVTGHVKPKLSFGLDFPDADVEATAFVGADFFTTFSTGIQSTFDKRDHSRELFKRGTIASVSVDAGVGFDVGVLGSLGPLSDGDEIILATVDRNLFNRNFPISGPSLTRREVEAPQVFKRDDDVTQCPSASDITATLTKLI